MLRRGRLTLPQRHFQSPIVCRSSVVRHVSKTTGHSITVRLSSTSAQSPAALVGNIATNLPYSGSANYLEDLFVTWQKDHTAVDPTLSNWFEGVQSFAARVSGAPSAGTAGTVGAAVRPDTATMQAIIRDHVKVVLLIRAYQVRGHHLASLDPLNFYTPRQYDMPPPPETQLQYYGFTEADLDREFFLGAEQTGFLSSRGGVKTLRQILQNLKEAYCGPVGYEYMHIASREQCNWLRERIERPPPVLPKEERIHIFDRLAWATRFEEYLALKYKGVKRFGLEGCESLIPGMKAFIDLSSELGIEHVVMGMAHRGRLNVLANVMRKPLATIFSEFAGFVGTGYGTGDVKYHLGLSVTREKNGKKMSLSLMPNPSHLEAVNPVVEGKARAKQFVLGDKERSKVMSVLIHGDAAFAGQGVVYETMGFSDLHDYTTGGTVHIIINNQIGFTADPRHARSSPYCSDLAKTLQAPIFHVNGDDPEAVVRVCKLAVEWRQTFKKDVVIDIVCYRRHGHNETDEPRFTQPLMYKKIAEHPTTLQLYKRRLVENGVLTDEEAEGIIAKINKALDSEFEKSKAGNVQAINWHRSGDWLDLSKQPPTPYTGITEEAFKTVGKALYTIPAHFTVHPNILKDLKVPALYDACTGYKYISHCLTLNRHHVRLSGQDVERGTFSHRHARLWDQNTEEPYEPLNHISPNQAPFHVSNSSLSEFGVLGFELGYSYESPNHLVLWEAQFGDFANGAQVVIDQFISAGEAKWNRQSGLTMLLPHGYEGQGPEHSSGRIERYLQLCDEDPDVFQEDMDQQLRNINMQVVNCTTPANFFHVLRRQIYRPYRKPLIAFTPKSLLRHRLCTSAPAEFTGETKFQPTLPGISPLGVPNDKVRRLVFLSGKILVDIEMSRFLESDKRKKEGLSPLPLLDIAFVRLEQLVPFPFADVARHILHYPNAEIVWCQEEPKNMGAWSYFEPRLDTILRKLNLKRTVRYIGRPVAASPATGYQSVHNEQQAAIIAEVLK